MEEKNSNTRSTRDQIRHARESSDADTAYQQGEVKASWPLQRGLPFSKGLLSSPTHYLGSSGECGFIV